MKEKELNRNRFYLRIKNYQNQTKSKQLTSMLQPKWPKYQRITQLKKKKSQQFKADFW